MNKKIINGLLIGIFAFSGFFYSYMSGHTTRGQEREFREIEAQLINRGINPSSLGEKRAKKLAKDAFYCREQITLAMEWLAQEEPKRALDNIIRAKGLLEELKKEGVPTDRYEEDLKAVEFALYKIKDIK